MRCSRCPRHGFLAKQGLPRERSAQGMSISISDPRFIRRREDQNLCRKLSRARIKPLCNQPTIMGSISDSPRGNTSPKESLACRVFVLTYSLSFLSNLRSRSDPSIMAFSPICLMRVRRTVYPFGLSPFRYTSSILRSDSPSIPFLTICYDIVATLIFDLCYNIVVDTRCRSPRRNSKREESREKQ